jgi:membrane-associated phospholipid phosphatase
VHVVLDAIADAVNPLLALTAIIVLALDLRAGRWRSSLATALGVAGIYVVLFADRSLHLWQRCHADYSTHAAFATTITVSLLVLRPPWRGVLLAVWIAYLALIVFLGYHSVADVIVAAVIAIIVTLPWHALYSSPFSRT